MQLDHRAGDGEAEARTLVAAGHLQRDLRERPPEPRQGRARDADAAVLDEDVDVLPRPSGADRDPPVGRRELHRVLQQVDQDLLERRRVGQDVEA